MENKLKVGILGGDMRQAALSSFFASEGIECAVWGVENITSDKPNDNIVKTIDWKGALRETKAIILPLPVTTDGVRLNCSRKVYSSNLYVPRISEIIENVSKETMIFGGKITPSIFRLASERKIKMIDYYESEEFQIKNAVPTAEGAIAVAIGEMDITLAGSTAAVVGYGRIGRTLTLRLLALGCNVVCIARSKKDLAWAVCDGAKPLPIKVYLENPQNFDVIFNTVPHVIFDEIIIPKLPFNQLFIDLASLNGGIDTDCANKYGVKVIKATSLPGKCSPVTAGKIIFDSVKEVLNEEGVLR